ncbi:MAG TPA: aquaporin [Gemmatimonadales bacterium]|nr:aquaporin [Gemmatimonadales bacterium]
MNSKTLRPLVAECIGTALFVFLGAGSVVANAMGGGRIGPIGPLGIALTHGLAMAVIVSCTMTISGGHINPAVTFGLWIAKKIDLPTAGGYVLAQLLGAVVGAALLPTVFTPASVRAMSYGTPLLASTTTLGQGIMLEAVMTFFLVSAVFGTVVSKEAPKIGGFGVGIAILVCGLMGGAATGAAMNPARAFGPAIVSFTLTGQVVYWIGPLVGAAVAAVVWGKVLLPKDV